MGWSGYDGGSIPHGCICKAKPGKSCMKQTEVPSKFPFLFLSVLPKVELCKKRTVRFRYWQFALVNMLSIYRRSMEQVHYFPIQIYTIPSVCPLWVGALHRETATIGGVAADCKSVPMR